MVLVKLGATRVSAGGQTRLQIIIPEGAKLISINAINTTTPNLGFRVDLCRLSTNIDDSTSDIDSFPILEGEQIGTYTPIIHLPIPFDVGEWRKVVATFGTAVASDNLSLGVMVDV